jgi:hypothetical protein
MKIEAPKQTRRAHTEFRKRAVIQFGASALAPILRSHASCLVWLARRPSAGSHIFHPKPANIPHALHFAAFEMPRVTTGLHLLGPAVKELFTR